MPYWNKQGTRSTAFTATNFSVSVRRHTVFAGKLVTSVGAQEREVSHARLYHLRHSRYGHHRPWRVLVASSNGSRDAAIAAAAQTAQTGHGVKPYPLQRSQPRLGSFDCLARMLTRGFMPPPLPCCGHACARRCRTCDMAVRQLGWLQCDHKPCTEGSPRRSRHGALVLRGP
jgi:hypothetical protein